MTAHLNDRGRDVYTLQDKNTSNISVPQQPEIYSNPIFQNQEPFSNPQGEILILVFIHTAVLLLSDFHTVIKKKIT